MPLPLYLLTAVVWFVLSFALPHSEAVTTGALVARTESVSHPPDMPTLEPQSWCQEVIPNGKGNVNWHTMTGPCTYNTLRGDVTLKGTEWVQIQPTATVPNGPSQSDSRCIFSKVKTQLGNGNAYWKPADDESAQKDCNDYCARIATQVGDGDKIKSATCFKNDNKPWVNKQGKQPSDDLPFGDRIYGVGECICDWPLLNDLVEDMVTKALPAIGEITCKTFYTAIDSVVAVGLNAIPGMAGVGAAGVRVAAQAAQVMSWTFSDPNEALEQYINWLQHPAGGDSAETDKEATTGPMDNICGNKYTPEGAEKIFNSFQFAANFASAPKLFAGAAKSWPPPFGQGSKNVDEARDFIKGLGKGKNDDDKQKPKPTQSLDRGVPTTSPSPKKTEEPQSRQQSSVTSNKQKECKRGDGDDGCAITKYIVDKMIPKKKVIEVKCDHKLYPQACAHYYSAIHERNLPAELTCSESHNKDGRKNAQATNDWTKQHKNSVWKSFTAENVMNNKGEVKPPSCEADEFPPSYFLDKDKRMPQIVRWIPAYDNGGAGQLWKQFCMKNDGNLGNGQRLKKSGKSEDDTLIEFNEDNIELNGLKSQTNVGKDQKTTVTRRWDTATYANAVFSMIFDYKGDETPRKQNNWHLETNECWPTDIIPQDPGYVLLKDDKWYENNEGFADAKNWRDLYANPPSDDLLKAAEDKRGNPKKHGADESGGDQPPTQAPKKNPPRAVGAEKLELYEGRLIARDHETNTTRPLTNDEIRDQIEVVPCKDKHCADELQGRDIDANALLIPAVPPPSAPSVNHDAVPTFTPTRSMRTEIRPQRRTSVIPDMPVVTD